MLPNPLLHGEGPVPVRPVPIFLPIRGEAAPKIPKGMPQAVDRPIFAVTAGVPVEIEANNQSDPLYLYQVRLTFAAHNGRGGGTPPDGPYGIYISQGGRIKCRLIDRQVRLSTDSISDLELKETCPFLEMPWALNRTEKLIFVYGLVVDEPGNSSDHSTPGAPTAVTGLAVHYIIRR